MRTWHLIAVATAVCVAVGTTALVNTWAGPRPDRRPSLQSPAPLPPTRAPAVGAQGSPPPPSGGRPKAKHPVPKGYVLTHEHPTNPMAFGGNYAFTGAPGNYRNGIMD